MFLALSMAIFFVVLVFILALSWQSPSFCFAVILFFPNPFRFIPTHLTTMDNFF